MNLFIVGAGFTKAVFPEAPLNKDLLSTITSKLQKSAAQALIDLYKIQDIEIALTRLDLEIGELKGVGESKKELRKNIEEEIANYFYNFCASESILENNPWFKSFIRDVISDGDKIVSLNYDCLIEGALDCCEKWSPKGGYGSSIDNFLASSSDVPISPVSVLKIHGSANFVIAPTLNRPEIKHIGLEFNGHFLPRSARYSNFGYGAGSGVTYIIAPSFVKIPAVEISYLMLDALRATDEAKNLIVIGCSLRPEDDFLTLLITNFLHKENWQERKIVVVDPAANSICKTLNDYWGVNVSEQILPIEVKFEDSIDELISITREQRKKTERDKKKP